MMTSIPNMQNKRRERNLSILENMGDNLHNIRSCHERWVKILLCRKTMDYVWTICRPFLPRMADMQCHLTTSEIMEESLEIQAKLWKKSDEVWPSRKSSQGRSTYSNDDILQEIKFISKSGESKVKVLKGFCTLFYLLVGPQLYPSGI